MEATTILPTRRRPQRSRELWRELLDRFEDSEQDCEQFCTAHDLGLSTFSRWRKQLRPPAGPPPKRA